MAEILFFGLFLFLIFVGGVILFYKEEDFWYKFLYMCSNIVHFIFLLILSYLLICDYFNLSTVHDTVVLDKMDINNLVFVSAESYTSNTIDFVYNFKNIPIEDENNYIEVSFCFYYNNTDNLPNVVRVVSGVTPISDYVYLNNRTFGSECVHINNSYVTDNALLGLTCEDCAVGNPLQIPEVQLSEFISEIHISKADPTTYTFENKDTAHVFYLQVTKCVGDIVREYYWYYMLSLTFFIIGFGYRWGFKHYLEDLPDEIR